MTQGQCDGLADTAYSGIGVNQHCAFKEAHFLWQDGSYGSPTTGFPSYGWIGQGGDTYLLRGSIGTGASYRVGWNNASQAQDPTTNIYSGIPGDNGGSGIPVPPSGTAANPTHILGENYASCSAQSARTQLHGGYGIYMVLDLRGAANVDVQCLDITDFSNCSLTGSATSPCNKNQGSLSDFAANGIGFLNTSKNIHMTNVRVHGLAGSGIFGPTGDGAVFKGLDIIGNSGAGWNADPSTNPETTGSGSLLVQNYNISWNGCTEEYPIVHALPYNQCADDSSGGYGDGFGTASIKADSAWTVVFDQGTASYNTQDGLDALHLYGNGSNITVTRTLAYGNMGQQIKVGGSAGVVENNLIVTNCNALRVNIPGTPAGYNSKLSDFCRAADTGVALAIGNGSTLNFNNNTIYSANATTLEIDCADGDGKCDQTALMNYQNNIFIGFLNSPTNGYTGRYDTGTLDYANPIFRSTSTMPMTNPGSLWSNNITFHPKSNWSCPSKGETKASCADPQLTDETWHNYGYPDATPAGGSPALGAGAAIPGVTVDVAGKARPASPAIGAFEK